MMLQTVLSLWLMFSLAGPAMAQERPTSPSVDSRIGVSLPASLGPLKSAGRKQYDQPELGVAYRYEAEPFIKTDIYIYDLGKKNLGTGLTPEVKAHFEQVKNDIYQMEKLGRYRSLTKVSEEQKTITTPSRKIPVLSATIKYSQAPGEGTAYTGMRISHLLLTAYRDSFIKVRFTYPEDQQAQGGKAFAQFLDDFGKILK